MAAVEASAAVLDSARVAWRNRDAVGVSAKAPLSARDTTMFAVAVTASVRANVSDTTVKAVMTADDSSATLDVSVACAK